MDEGSASLVVGPGPTRVPRLPAIEEPQLRAEMAALLRRRLLILVLFLWAIGTAFYLLNVAICVLVEGRGWAWIREEVPLLVGTLVWGLIPLALRRPTVSKDLVEVLDALALFAVFAIILLEYETTFKTGGGRTLYYLGVLIPLRAVVVPSRGLRTFLLSLPAAIAVLAIQVTHAAHGDPVPNTSPGWREVAPGSALWWSSVVWDQVYLLVAIGVATLASRVNFSLRLRALEARAMGRYVLEERIGEGGMGSVWRARHPLLARPVALKFLRGDVGGEDALARFGQEIRSTSLLTHPNTIAVYDGGETSDGSAYYAMEYLPGADLRTVVSRGGPMPAARAVHVLSQMLGSLEEAHRKGLVHRDVKPENVLLGERGLEWDVVKVTDFGLVKDLARTTPVRTVTGQVLGTPETLAPEIARGEAATPATDLYGVGGIGYYLLTGKAPFEGRDVLSLIAAAAAGPPRPPSEHVASVPKDVEAVVLRALAKDPRSRPASAAAMRDDLLRCADAGRWSAEDARSWWSAHRDLVPGAFPAERST